MIECHSLYGGKKLVPAGSLRFRPSVYAIVPHAGKLLLARMRSTGAYCLPGGGIELGERMEAALQREVREEAGIAIEVGRLAFFKEDFFYYDPLEAAFHSFQFFYICRPVTFELLPDDRVQDDEAEQPRWVERGGLQAGDFYNDGQPILDALAAEA